MKTSPFCFFNLGGASVTATISDTVLIVVKTATHKMPVCYGLQFRKSTPELSSTDARLQHSISRFSATPTDLVSHSGYVAQLPVLLESCGAKYRLTAWVANQILPSNVATTARLWVTFSYIAHTLHNFTIARQSSRVQCCQFAIQLSSGVGSCNTLIVRCWSSVRHLLLACNTESRWLLRVLEQKPEKSSTSCSDNFQTELALATSNLQRRNVYERILYFKSWIPTVGPQR